MKRKLIQRPSTLILLLCSLIMGTSVSAHASGWVVFKGIVGSWELLIQPDQPDAAPFKNLATNTLGRAVINSDPVFGTGHGAWQRTGYKQYQVRFLTLIPPDNPDFPPGSSVIVFGQLTQDSADSVSGSFNNEFYDAEGNLLFAGSGSISGTRLNAD